MKSKSFKIFSFFIISFLFFVAVKYVSASWADHLVISEVQISGGVGKTTNDFIEIYNPTQSVIDISSWKLRKRTQTGGESSIKVFSEGKNIPAHGFFLWANSNNGYDQTINADEASTQTIADNNSIALFNTSDVLIDALAWGSGHVNPFFEGSTTSTPVNPEANQSLERNPSGENGNGEDTNENYSDFFLQVMPNPQNSYASSTPPISGPICGNNIKEIGEQCDGVDLDNQTCFSKGFVGGILTCGSSCTFDVSNCSSGGNGVSVSENYDESDVVINELVSDPVDDEKEWVELYNKTAQEIDLANWSFEDGTETKKNLSGKISSKGFLVIENLNFSLNNSGDSLILRSPNSVLIDKVTYGNWNDGDLSDNALAAPDPKSLARINDGSDTNNDFLDFQITETKTKGTKNIFNQSLDDDSDQENENILTKIIISEVLPNPTGSDNEEWLEIYNADNKEINLKNWQLDDADGGSNPYRIKIDLIIKPDQYLIFKKEETKISFNNSEDSIRLLGPNGRLVEEVSYEDVLEGFSYARENNSWFWTNVLTPGAKNIIGENVENNDLNEDQLVPIKLTDLRQLDVGTKIETSGVVSVRPGILGAQIFYLAGSGVQIYCYKKEFPNLKIGDLIKVNGEIAEYHGETRIKIAQKSDISIIKHNQEIKIHQVKTSEIDEDLEGSVISIEAQLLEASGNYWYLDDGSGEIKVYFKSSTGIKKPKIKEGEWLKITGIVSQYDEEYRLLPRFQEDVVSLGQKSTGNDDNFELTGSFSTIDGMAHKNIFSQINNLGVTKYFIVSAIFLAAILIALLIRKKV
jgi:DNA/RNA endonuclease YhcR with UshA esterase domain